MVRKDRKKDIVSIMAAHGAPYVAQVAPNKWKDMVKKKSKEVLIQMDLYLSMQCLLVQLSGNLLQIKQLEVSDLAVDSFVFPLYEIIDGNELNIYIYRPKKYNSSKRLFRCTTKI